MSDEPKILNLADLLREAERQREESRMPAPAERPWCPWPEVFNAGTCEENQALSALCSAHGLLFEAWGINPNLRQKETVDAWRRAGAGYEFKLSADNRKGYLVLRVVLDEDGAEKVEVRRV